MGHDAAWAVAALAAQPNLLLLRIDPATLEETNATDLGSGTVFNVPIGVSLDSV